MTFQRRTSSRQREEPMNFISFFGIVTAIGFAILFVCVGGGVAIAGDAGGMVGYFVALIVAGVAGVLLGKWTDL